MSVVDLAAKTLWNFKDAFGFILHPIKKYFAALIRMEDWKSSRNPPKFTTLSKVNQILFQG